MKKRVHLIIAVIIAMLSVISPAYAENERLEMNTEEYGSLKIIENAPILNDVTKYDDSSKYHENGKFIRYYECSSILGHFISRDKLNLESFLLRPDVKEKYMLINGPEFDRYKRFEISDDAVIGGNLWFDSSQIKYIQDYLLNYQYVLRQLPGSPAIKNIYFFHQVMREYHDAIYFETSSGDYILYRESERDDPHLFTVEEFHKYAQDVDKEIKKNLYIEHDLRKDGYDVSSNIDPNDYTSLKFREKTALKWYHIVGGIVLAAVVSSAVAFVAIRHRKHKKI